MTYRAVRIHRDANRNFGVSFPDDLGCVTAGYSLEEARSMAEEARRPHIKELLENGDEARPPSLLGEIMDEAEDLNAVAVMIQAKDQEKAIRVNIAIPDGDLRAIDDARNYGLSRSGLLAKAAKEVMADNRL